MALMEPETPAPRLASNATPLASDARHRAQRQMPASSGKIDAHMRAPAAAEGENPTRPPTMRLAPNAITPISAYTPRRAG